ncbi:MAG: ATP-binding protein, partial [Microcystaceae cyanobacterium]
KISSSSDISNKEKEQLVNEQKAWITKRVEETQLELKIDEVVSVNINQVIREVVKSFSFEFSDVDIKIEVMYDDKIPIIYIDERKIKDIISNLLSNAEKAIKKANTKKGEIAIATVIDTSERIQYIQITVEDNGIGIPNEVREKIFEKGFTTRKDEGGTGLGLFVVREILNNYGGKIDFKSRVGKGTKFDIKIPLKRYQF